MGKSQLQENSTTFNLWMNKINNYKLVIVTTGYM